MLEKHIAVNTIVFTLAPRINAVGRISNAKKAVHLLSAKSLQQARNIARIMENENKARKNIDEVTYNEAQQMVEAKEDLEEKRILVHWKKSKVRQRELELLTEEAKEKLNKYEEQLYQVKTNKEYDAITTETDTVKETISSNEQELLYLDDKLTELSTNIEELETEVSKLDDELSENKVELQSTLNATAEEENLLKQERDIILQKSSPDIINSYELVRKARDGQGIAMVAGNNCGGCYSFIPPQKIVEIKKMKKIYTCEYCGRILVFNEANS